MIIAVLESTLCTFFARECLKNSIAGISHSISLLMHEYIYPNFLSIYHVIRFWIFFFQPYKIACECTMQMPRASSIMYQKQYYKSCPVNRCPVIPSDNFAADFCITLIQSNAIYFFTVIYFFY